MNPLVVAVLCTAFLTLVFERAPVGARLLIEFLATLGLRL